MIIARAPLRISFAGGGTDLPGFYKRHGPGAVISTSINRYVYVTVSRKFDRKVSVRYRNHESVERVRDLEHDLIREVLLHYGVERDVEVVVASEVPAKGSGLGASSALAVALCAALEIFVGKRIMALDPISPDGKRKLAETASGIEIKKVASPIGKQDHYASALGGMNFLRFHSDESVEVVPFERTEFIAELESQSMLFYMNIGHTYLKDGQERIDRFFVPRILHRQVQEIDEMKGVYALQRDNALRLMEHMEYQVIERFMDHVNENWRLKKKLHGEISSGEIDEFMERAFRAGATAGKVCGAGGGGFAYLMAPPDMQGNVRRELSEYLELKFGFDERGVEVVFSDSEKVGVCA